jgi:hypothetical protein
MSRVAGFAQQLELRNLLVEVVQTEGAAQR